MSEEKELKMSELYRKLADNLTSLLSSIVEQQQMNAEAIQDLTKIAGRIVELLAPLHGVDFEDLPSQHKRGE